MNKTQKVIIIKGASHFLDEDAHGTLTLWRGLPDDPSPLAVEDADTCDPFLWDLVLTAFDN